VWFDHVIRDVRFATRVLLKDLRFTVLAVLGLALGIGITTAVFALINEGIRVNTEAAGDLASFVSLNRLESGHWQNGFSYDEYRYYRDHATAFRAVTAQSGRFPCVLGPIAKTGAEDVEARFVSANFQSATGLWPALGRSFTSEEEQGGGPLTALLSAWYWKAHFAADRGILGRTVMLNAHPVTIVGVADPRFGAADKSGFYLPLGSQPMLAARGDWLRDPDQQWLMLDAVLQPGVTPRQAQSEVEVLLAARRRTKSDDPTEGSLRVTPGGGNPGKRRQLLALAVTITLAVAMILLIACSNLANLLLARAVVRRREIAVRLSLGASRMRLICQLLTESMLLALAGGALGILFSHWLAQTIFAEFGAPNGFELRLDPRVLLYGTALSIATGLSFGLAPALSATKTNLAQAFHADGLSGATHARRVWSARNGLVIVPLAVSLMLLLGAGMAVRGVQHVYLNGPAFEASRLVAMSTPLNLEGYDEARTREFQDRLRDRISAMPGVRSVTLASNMPLSNGMGSFPLADPPSARVDYNVVSPDFLSTIGVTVVRGRAFTAADREGSQPVAMVNQNLARRFWPNEEPVGKQIRLRAGSTPFEVVGVAPDMEDPEGVFNTVRPTVYVPDGQGNLFLKGTRTDVPPYQMQLLIRTAGDATSVKSAVRREALALDPSLRVVVETAAEMQESALGPFRMISLLLSALGALALVMASIGIYAILAYAVSQRTREIGIRMALGAQRREVLSLVMQRTVALIVWGIGLGMAGSLALKRVMSSTVEQLGGLDALTCIVVALLLGAVALLASYLPARKALRVDPAHALRWE
jgi:predicted permease